MINNRLVNNFGAKEFKVFVIFNLNKRVKGGKKLIHFYVNNTSK